MPRKKAGGEPRYVMISVVAETYRVHPQTLQEAGGKVASFIGSDNFEGGKLAGEFIVRKLDGSAKVAVLEGIPGHETGDSRLKGFHAAVETHPGIQVVASQTANWERDQGYNVFQNILQSHPQVQAPDCSQPLKPHRRRCACARHEPRRYPLAPSGSPIEA